MVILRLRLWALGPVIFAVASLAPQPTFAWLSPGHMATGAIAYDSLNRRDPAAVAAIVGLEQFHPDRARLDQMLGGLEGAAREKKLFELMARWPDDARGGVYDRPSWHFVEKIQSSLRYLLPFAFGDARTAYLDELRVAWDPHAPDNQRAIALCWVLHIVGDMHEPEHAGLWMSSQFPLTDQGGNVAWVRTTSAMRPEGLHLFWDSAGAVDPDEGDSRNPDLFAARLEVEHPDTFIPRPDDPGRAFDGWVEESRDLSRHIAYRDGSVALGVSPQTAALLPPDYVVQVQKVGEDRIAKAGYRIAALLEGLR